MNFTNLKKSDPEIMNIVELETKTTRTFGTNCFENFVTPQVMEAMGSH